MKFNRLSKYKIRKTLKLFSKDLHASLAAQILKINPNTINRYYNLFREAIFKDSLLALEKELSSRPLITLKGSILMRFA